MKKLALFIFAGLSAFSIYAGIRLDGTTCLSVSSDRIYHDTDCDNAKDAGEEFIDQAGGGGGYAVEPATVTFQLDLGFSASSGVITTDGTYDGLTIKGPYGTSASVFPFVPENTSAAATGNILSLPFYLQNGVARTAMGVIVSSVTRTGAAVDASDLILRVRSGGTSKDGIIIRGNTGGAGTNPTIVTPYLDCSGNANSGKLTADSSGNVTCGDDISGGGGTSSLAVGTGTATSFTNNITSPTAAISFLGDQFLGVKSGTTHFVTIDTMSSTGLMALSTGTNSAGQLVRLDGNADVLDANLSANVSLLGQSIGAAEMANADHGDVSWSGGVATVDNVAAANVAAGSLGSSVLASSLPATVAYKTESSTDAFTFSLSTPSWNSLTFPGHSLDAIEGSTITMVLAETMPSGSTVTFSLNYRNLGSLNSAGTEIFSVTYSTANSDGKTITAFANTLVPAKASVTLSTPANGAGAGSPTHLRVTVFYKRRDR